MLISKDRLLELENSPYRVPSKPPLKRRTGKNLHPQLTIRVAPELKEQVEGQMKLAKEKLKENGITLSYLKNLNTLSRYLFDRYLEGHYDAIHDKTKIMLPTVCPTVAIRYPEEKVRKLRKKIEKTNHTFVSVIARLFEAWLDE